MSSSWSWYIIILTVVFTIAITWLLLANSRKTKADEAGTASDTGHVWDGITELDHPLPRWWFVLFLLTILFTALYLALYPGMGTFDGKLGWTSVQEANAELDETNARLETLYAGFRDRPLAELAKDPNATKVGRNVFANNCAACHGTDARGAKGYPNLVDGDWLYGGEPDTVLASVLNGRHGLMPPMVATLPGNGVDEVSHYVLSLSGIDHDARLAGEGKAKFEAVCAACHGVDGKGMHALGAPDLTDDVWLHGQGNLAAIRDAITYGRSGEMPAWEPIIGMDRSRLAVAWLLAQGAANAESESTAAGNAP
ncbi:MAG TPA: cytochrome-c oxidase, cbb3-type subunit III [Dokdonella sp.]|uniref:cytochrome-c oxidase, cbb3-type subunit III n=1 Tax=Dokdonella sp. TaxID=2291710 RepID=UPI0025BA9E2F|nr:cytochrome-c oxidase, cbb3-type subunit III [Dokdonella sp.]MBX3692689.1 cytochrome-c oxidase, cbb3-type subunit III [Dokdonella sp.]MCW5568642.1 cytochrome-c oxidase, cbb3-type subunit III [Dokdonella sp.]HNR91362.1 cytochrome-c oxidase, cbb3-type subunit III [Dokdonella sp.]